MELLKNTSINKHIIELENGKKSLYWPIYNLGLVELETLKAYIKTYLKTRFIQLSKSSIRVSIFFNKNPNGSLYLYINYRRLNNLTLKYWYLLPLIGKFLDQLDQTKQFT